MGSRAKLYAVVGAGSVTGMFTARELLQRGGNVRCIMRDPERYRAELDEMIAYFPRGKRGNLEYCAADVTKPETLPAGARPARRGAGQRAARRAFATTARTPLRPARVARAGGLRHARRGGHALRGTHADVARAVRCFHGSVGAGRGGHILRVGLRLVGRRRFVRRGLLGACPRRCATPALRPAEATRRCQHAPQRARADWPGVCAPQGVKNVAEAALAAGVKKMVLCSCFMVSGTPLAKRLAKRTAHVLTQSTRAMQTGNASA